MLKEIVKEKGSKLVLLALLEVLIEKGMEDSPLYRSIKKAFHCKKQYD